ncbi:MAG: hypothetical protein GX465_16650 [Acidobacteria bacterium]|jgi:outer membrane protein assembly factor BamE (lipoprotein component of BamABCDE complex)|nr:MAG: hypothetical protein AO394_10485 [Candidatus Fermentibacter daniensis]NLH78659.1 hypothetical protein [Acidobacteriota bacterium]
MRRFALLVLPVVPMLLAACGSPLTSPALVGPEPSPDFNRGFITVDETTQFYSGMASSTVLSTCGEPLYVAYGGRDRIVWVYQVRELLVRSQSRTVPAKTSEVTMFGEPLHYIALSFQGNSLEIWAPISMGDFFNTEVFDGLLEPRRDEAAEVTD